jgi:hypothetical protein
VRWPSPARIERRHQDVSEEFVTGAWRVAPAPCQYAARDVRAPGNRHAVRHHAFVQDRVIADRHIIPQHRS